MTTEGFLNVHKPVGMTSHDVVSVVRRALGVRRVGHAGTLDPGATGVLPIAVGKATRLIEYITDTDKEYEAVVEFGYETDSGDLDGQIVARSDAPPPEKEMLLKACAAFEGVIDQIPPMHSALKVNGKKLCNLARQGIVVERPARQITIHALELLTYDGAKARLRIVCSKGTYIRVLCSDLAKAVGCLGVMVELCRTRVGQFRLEDGASLDEIREKQEKLLQPIPNAIAHLPQLLLNEAQSRAFCLGQKQWLEQVSAADEIVRVCESADESLLGIGRVELQDTLWQLAPHKVLATPQQKEQMTEEEHGFADIT
nr:tRNA pseudouridine(55) synthase TruB [uncultured Anaeromusa sp.]